MRCEQSAPVLGPRWCRAMKLANRRDAKGKGKGAKGAPGPHVSDDELSDAGPDDYAVQPRGWACCYLSYYLLSMLKGRRGCGKIHHL